LIDFFGEGLKLVFTLVWCGVVRVVEIVVIFVVTANLFFSDCRFLGGFIFLDTETSAKSAIEPDPAYSLHTAGKIPPIDDREGKGGGDGGSR
jgi:hypothetical protein